MDQDLDRDLLLAATSASDPVVQRLKKRYRCCITFRPRAGLDAWRNQILTVMLPSSGIAASSSIASPSPPPPSPPPDLSVRSPCVPEFVADPDTAVSMTGEGRPRPLTCDPQCAGCLTLQSEIARLQQAEQDALARVGMLEAELQHLRSQPLDGGPTAEPASVAPTDVEDSALDAEIPVASAIASPPAPARAQNWHVVVRGLPCSDIVTTAVLHSTFSQFCCDRLRLRDAPRMRVVRRLTSRPGTAAGVVALHSQEDYEALFGAARGCLTADCPTSIEPSGSRTQRRARAEARRARRAVAPQQRAGAAGGRAGSAGHPPMHSSLRHDAPEFVPASATLPSQSVSLPCTCPVALSPDLQHQE